jgi:hypothetical protein
MLLGKRQYGIPWLRQLPAFSATAPYLGRHVTHQFYDLDLTPPSTMSSTSSNANLGPFKSFNPQEVIDYCESRMRAAFNTMERLNADWIYDGMMNELVSSIHSRVNEIS